MDSWFSFVSTDGSVPKAELIRKIPPPWGQMELSVLWNNSLPKTTLYRQWLGKRNLMGTGTISHQGENLNSKILELNMCYLDCSRLLNRGEKQPVVTPTFFIWWDQFSERRMIMDALQCNCCQDLTFSHQSWRGLQVKSLNPFTSSCKDGLFTFLEEPGFVVQTGGGGSGGKRAKASAVFNTKA